MVVECIEEMALGFVGCPRSLGRKRIAISSNTETSQVDSESMTPLKRMCSGKIDVSSERSPLEALPQDLLTRVLCGVDHEDLKQLFHVSKTIREAALIAKQWHFEYSTPKKKTFAFLDSSNAEDQNDFYEIEAQNAPLRKYKPRIMGKKELARISVALFASPED